VQHFPVLGLLPPPIDGWSDTTELYVARFGMPKAGKAIWIRTCQHIDAGIRRATEGILGQQLSFCLTGRVRRSVRAVRKPVFQGPRARSDAPYPAPEANNETC
jgi:hypothetical protein